MRKILCLLDKTSSRLIQKQRENVSEGDRGCCIGANKMPAKPEEKPTEEPKAQKQPEEKKDETEPKDQQVSLVKWMGGVGFAEMDGVG